MKLYNLEKFYQVPHECSTVYVLCVVDSNPLNEHTFPNYNRGR